MTREHMWVKLKDNRFIGLKGIAFDDCLYSWDSFVIICPNEIPNLVDMLKESEFFWVDENLVNFIAYLNLGKFYTEYSCSGHNHNGKDCEAYVMFKEGVSIDKLRLPQAMENVLVKSFIKRSAIIRFNFRSQEERITGIAALDVWSRKHIGGVEYYYYPYKGNNKILDFKEVYKGKECSYLRITV